MSCGTKINGRHGTLWEREEIVEALEKDGEYRLAQMVRREECFDSLDLRRAESSLMHSNLSKNFDYREDKCRCSTDEDLY